MIFKVLMFVKKQGNKQRGSYQDQGPEGEKGRVVRGSDRLPLQIQQL